MTSVPPELLTAKEVARKLRVGVRTVWRWVALGKLPQPMRFSASTVRWRPEDIQRYLDRLAG